MGWNPSARAGTQGRQSRWDVAGCLAETWPASADCVDRGSALVLSSVKDYDASRAATLVSRVSILALASCKALMSINVKTEVLTPL